MSDTTETVEGEVVDEVRAEMEVIEREQAIAEPPKTVLPSIPEWEAMRAVAHEIAKTEFVPVDLRGRPDAVLAAILAGREIGIGPMEALRQIHVIDGRPVFSAALMMSLMRRGGLVILTSESTLDRAFIKARRTDTGEEAEVEWTYAEAEQITSRGKKLVDKDNWRNYRADMLWARCVGRLARRLGSDLLGGMVYSAEEVAEWDDREGGYETGNGEPKALAPAKPKSWKELLEAMNRDLYEHPWQEWWAEAAAHSYGLRIDRSGPFGDVIAAIRTAKGDDEVAKFWQRACKAYDAMPRSDLGPTRMEVRKVFYESFDGVVCEGPKVTMSPDEAEFFPTYEMYRAGNFQPAQVVATETGPSDTTPSEESGAPSGVTADAGLGEEEPAPSVAATPNPSTDPFPDGY